MIAEYNHIISVTKNLKKRVKGSDDWWRYFRWIEERVHNGWRIGELDFEEYSKLLKLVKKIEADGRSASSKSI